MNLIKVVSYSVFDGPHMGLTVDVVANAPTWAPSWLVCRLALRSMSSGSRQVLAGLPPLEEVVRRRDQDRRKFLWQFRWTGRPTSWARQENGEWQVVQS